ncbi:hypothetical protein AEYBE204_09970 [Asticcacaulis sp. YBE204]|nr:hypothetical protein AEYBE204_09970 [Asticcacaulis sp. YBE204]
MQRTNDLFKINFSPMPSCQSIVFHFVQKALA